MSLATRVAKLRRSKGQSLQEVADAVDVSKAHIWELEKGRADNPSMALVTRLADHFGVSVAFLAGEDIESPDGSHPGTHRVVGRLLYQFRRPSDFGPGIGETGAATRFNRARDSRRYDEVSAQASDVNGELYA